jgi:LacI family transcriptional regulator
MSIQALADSLGISISTVSRALNGYSDVSARTRQRVFDAAKAMNYTPHPVAHRLATGKTGAVAIINSARAGNAVDGNTAALQTGVAAVLREHNYFTLSLSLPMGEEEIPELERLLAARLVDGVVLTRTRTQDDRVKLLQERHIPFITHGRTLGNAPHAWVDTDNEGAFELATQALIEHGHRRIALINGMAYMTFASLREQGFRKALRNADIDEAHCPVHYTELSSAAGRHVAALLLASAPRPTAMLCATDALALGAMAAIRDAGLRVGEDVSVVGYGNSDAGQYAQPPLASIDHAIVDNGRHIAELLLRVMAGDNVSQVHRLEEVRLLPRPSLAACARQAQAVTME